MWLQVVVGVLMVASGARSGVLPDTSATPAEASVAVVVAAAHRAPAFDACRSAMDQVKSAAPIWKK